MDIASSKLIWEREVDAGVVLDCLAANRTGDGFLYAKLHCGIFSFDKNAKRWLIYDGQHWTIDTMNCHFSAAEYVAIEYEELLPMIDEQIHAAITAENVTETARLEKIKNRIERRAWRLRSARGVNACVNSALRVRTAAGTFPMIHQGGQGGNC